MTKHPSFRKKKSYTLPAVIIVLALAASFLIPGRLSFFRSAAVSVIYPFQFAAAAFWHGAIRLPANILDLRNLARNNAELKQTLDALGPKLAQIDELKTENDRLRATLGFQSKNRYGAGLLPAMVIGRGASTWNSIIEINRGAGANVKVDMPVVVGAGLVGKIVEVARFSSKVLLLTDPLSSIAAADQRSRDLGVAEGYSPNKLKMKFVSTGGDVAVGDLVVTSSVSGLFPPGIPVGVVSRASKKETDLFYEIEIKPAAELSRLEEVFVVL
ncbi:MAG: rod shape-determining protein MreC [Candidatus Margulisbacteria bacterium]|nr:rod shape-determining protein MreC [Candidatus Margulisiibacteriota bacterium]